MPAASLSRWTPVYFAASLVCLLTVEAVLALGTGASFSPGGGLFLALVHLMAVGWLSLLMIGALLQFVPVLASQPLAAPRLALPALILSVCGLAGLLCGFLGLDGLIAVPDLVLPLSGMLLAAGLLTAGGMIGATIARARPLPFPALFVAAGLAALAVTLALGALFSLGLGGLVGGETIAMAVASAPPLHAGFGLFGWLTLTAAGVSYRLLSMFMLSPEKPGLLGRLALALGAITLVLLAAAVSAIAARPELQEALRLSATGTGMAALAAYLADIAKLYGKRRRRVIDLSAKASAASFACLCLSLPLFALAAAGGYGEGLTNAAIYLFLFGWLTGLGLANLLKIVPFVTWLCHYGPLLGKKDVPRAQDLISEERALPFFLCHFLGTACGAVALGFGAWPAFHLASAIVFVGSLGLTREYVRARRLTYIQPERHPQAAAKRPQPRLLNGA